MLVVDLNFLHSHALASGVFVVEIKRTNTKVFEQLDLRIKELQGKEGKVGWLDKDTYPDGGPTIAYVATIQEFGSGPIPPRPFMRPTVTEQKETWQAIAAEQANRILAGKTDSQTAMEVLTFAAESAVYEKIVSITSPPLSLLTLLARKYKRDNPNKKITGKTIGELDKELRYGPPDVSGVSTKPLNDTGLMLAKLRSTVENATS